MKLLITITKPTKAPEKVVVQWIERILFNDYEILKDFVDYEINNDIIVMISPDMPINKRREFTKSRSGLEIMIIEH